MRWMENIAKRESKWWDMALSKLQVSHVKGGKQLWTCSLLETACPDTLRALALQPCLVLDYFSVFALVFALKTTVALRNAIQSRAIPLRTIQMRQVHAQAPSSAQKQGREPGGAITRLGNRSQMV